MHLLVSKAAEQAAPHVLTGEALIHLLCGDVYLGFGHLSRFFSYCELQKYSVCWPTACPGFSHSVLLLCSLVSAFEEVQFLFPFVD